MRNLIILVLIDHKKVSTYKLQNYALVFSSDLKSLGDIQERSEYLP